MLSESRPPCPNRCIPFFPCAVGPSLSADELGSIRQELLRRLDDSSNAIRVAACSTLRVYLSCLPPPLLDDTAAGQLASSVLVHMDDPDPAVQEAGCGVLEALAVAAPGAVRDRAAAAAGVHRSRVYLDRVLAACGVAF
jgi:hypothetical protein